MMQSLLDLPRRDSVSIVIQETKETIPHGAFGGGGPQSQQAPKGAASAPVMAAGAPQQPHDPIIPKIDGFDEESALREFRKQCAPQLVRAFPQIDYEAQNGGSESAPAFTGLGGFVMKSGSKIDAHAVQKFKQIKPKWCKSFGEKGTQRWVKEGSAHQQQHFPDNYTILRYSDDEYAMACQNEGWTRTETDILMNLVEQFEQRFFIVSDRWKMLFKEGKVVYREIEDLKDRFYTIQRNLIRLRNETAMTGVQQGNSTVEIPPPATFSLSLKNPLFAVTYDAAYDRQRKEELEKVFVRNDLDVVRASYLAIQNRELDKKIKASTVDEKRKHMIYELFTNLTTVAASAVPPDERKIEAQSPGRGGRNGSVSPSKKTGAGGAAASRKRKTRADIIGADTATLSNLFNGLPPETVQKHCFKPRGKGVHLRSSYPMEVPQTTRRNQQIIDDRVDAMGIGVKQQATKWLLEFHSHITCLVFDLIRREICTWSNASKLAKKKEEELRTLEMQLQQAKASMSLN
eukprot:TRINITY_DN2568_c0_g1_i1.p1 TRINITY_DN2568_c0_g1~~TRINITY_DN2568_c0_g1_i1.p1  ORF type:complete len:516 (-),score=137.14 TRINITY_DN2568_c0_g1_i1:56-1603(-)